MIYFIQHGITGPVKIGHATKDVRHRLQSLQTASPVKLVLLGVMDGDRKREKEVHAVFAEYRIRGEWFILSKMLLSFIDDNSVKSLCPDGDFDDRIVVHLPIWLREKLRAAAHNLNISFVDMIKDILKQQVSLASDRWISFELTSEGRAHIDTIAEKIGLSATNFDSIADVIYFALRLVAMGFVTIPEVGQE